MSLRRPEYYLSHDTIRRWADMDHPHTDFEMDVKQLAREFLRNEERLTRALAKLRRASARTK